ncbi:MAG: GNAT family N-acetyltransferase [Candidatus Omnitrophica bacterium]|nr:GNAT family N-acetyltransferase [Candidatus Omnitrophota bacterium]MCG2705482.1 GNAT family N-acetyltransferase [Candidatus Omnitrophota bacterium]
MQVRKFDTKDSADVKNLIVSILTKEYPFDKSVYENSDISSISDTYGGRKDVFFVIESDDDIIGTVGVKEDSKDTALLRRLFIKPSCRRKGYGSLLLSRALNHCRKNHFKQVVFRATGRMAQAINLLKKNGFKEAEKIDLGGFRIYKFVLDL